MPFLIEWHCCLCRWEGWLCDALDDPWGHNDKWKTVLCSLTSYVEYTPMHTHRHTHSPIHTLHPCTKLIDTEKRIVTDKGRDCRVVEMGEKVQTSNFKICQSWNGVLNVTTYLVFLGVLEHISVAVWDHRKNVRCQLNLNLRIFFF